VPQVADDVRESVACWRAEAELSHEEALTHARANKAEAHLSHENAKSSVRTMHKQKLEAAAEEREYIRAHPATSQSPMSQSHARATLSAAFRAHARSPHTRPLT
jgi:hypothetical protein